MAAAMSPGDVRVFKRGDGNAVVVGLGLWAKKDGSWIHIHMTGPDNSHTTVTNNPESVRFHRTLFRDLRNTLVRQNCWPFGEEGAEVKSEDPASHFHPVATLDGAVSASEMISAERGE
jgi:hypothetical protein